jgi:hypothetical protein
MFLPKPQVYYIQRAQRQLQTSKKNKFDDPDNVALNKGNTYFVDAAAYGNYLSLVGTVFEVSFRFTNFPVFSLKSFQKLTCNNLCAAQLQNVIKFKNAVISGIVVIQCLCHGFNDPQGMVDLSKGEGYVNSRIYYNPCSSYL